MDKDASIAREVKSRLKAHTQPQRPARFNFPPVTWPLDVFVSVTSRRVRVATGLAGVSLFHLLLGSHRSRESVVGLLTLRILVIYHYPYEHMDEKKTYVLLAQVQLDP
eukprot:g68146.t1